MAPLGSPVGCGRPTRAPALRARQERAHRGEKAPSAWKGVPRWHPQSQDRSAPSWQSERSYSSGCLDSRNTPARLAAEVRHLSLCRYRRRGLRAVGPRRADPPRPCARWRRRHLRVRVGRGDLVSAMAIIVIVDPVDLVGGADRDARGRGGRCDRTGRDGRCSRTRRVPGRRGDRVDARAAGIRSRPPLAGMPDAADSPCSSARRGSPTADAATSSRKLRWGRSGRSPDPGSRRRGAPGRWSGQSEGAVIDESTLTSEPLPVPHGRARRSRRHPQCGSGLRSARHSLLAP